MSFSFWCHFFSVLAIKNIGKWSEISSLSIPVFIVLCNSEFMIYSSRSIFCNSSWFVNDWNQTVFKCSIQKFRNFFIFIFVVVKKVKVEIPCGTEKFIGLQGNGIYIFQKNVKSFKITIWRPKGCWQDGAFWISWYQFYS